MGAADSTAKPQKAYPFTSTIKRADDPLVQCYCHENYNPYIDRLSAKLSDGSFSSRSVPIYMTVGAHRCKWHDPRVQLQGYPELHFKSTELQTLIRTKHVIDENDLETIGLSMYSFPTLSHFFVH